MPGSERTSKKITEIVHTPNDAPFNLITSMYNGNVKRENQLTVLYLIWPENGSNM